ncbi:hypothetical protein B0A52_06980 [Exophiala mesophila]|uniref:Methyltransferase domain-containing protein n=1 Tax=Exophiala mesophila TaxID=212818 RepID=A0A438N148_EXOME|nr:hypothetical protein B0A52_06980 [Exophiala mesophila]
MADHKHDHHHHGHHGHHEHHHGDSLQQNLPDDAFTEMNRKHWNDYAASYMKEQWQKDMIKLMTEFMVANHDWIGVDFADVSTSSEASALPKTVRVLDYACGPGTMTHALAGKATEYLGVDISENMVKAYNLRFNPEPVIDATATRSSEDIVDQSLNAQAVVGNLLAESGTPESLDGAKFHDFDLVVIGGGYHHFSNLTLATARLAERLKPGGVLLVLDFVSHGVSDSEKNHPAAPTIAHHGFNEQQLQAYFEGAGLVDFKMKKSGQALKMRGIEPREPLLARARKPHPTGTEQRPMKSEAAL